jgi:hypothetical protein
MGKLPQNRFRRLTIVGPTEKKRQPAAGQRWWGPKRPKIHPTTQEAIREKAEFKSLRMAVMPTLSRGMWIEALGWFGNFVRSYFVSAASRRQGGVVLSFRSHAARMHGFRRARAQEGFVSKKASGSVRWSSDREVAPQEGGRG